ncbi:hypothetical protein E0765_11160 [Sulfuricurvum sp. IAE1]|uniref:hypothetical protein n=1 Tax=Sulfuricurvum sp. IAE1 TaxID=2546102 RepID=UPI00104FCA48|nr:hypothetical protein [Sulfuricurvum sp. IAE1]TDA62370.1 hypothetical protein E0765_11160 [Sulfuricurvum sp. IAE1]
MFRKKKIIDLNTYSPRELQVIVDNYIREYHGNRNKNGIFKELDKIELQLVQMRDSGVSIEWIRKFILDTYNYKVGMHTLSDWYKTFHSTTD